MRHSCSVCVQLYILHDQNRRSWAVWVLSNCLKLNSEAVGSAQSGEPCRPCPAGASARSMVPRSPAKILRNVSVSRALQRSAVPEAQLTT